MRRELAALVARSPFGQGAAWPVVQTVQRDGHLRGGASRLRRDLTPNSAAPQASWRFSSQPNWAWSGCWPSSCSRPSTAG